MSCSADDDDDIHICRPFLLVYISIKYTSNVFKRNSHLYMLVGRYRNVQYILILSLELVIVGYIFMIFPPVLWPREQSPLS
jgi:hypothetical protein